MLAQAGADVNNASQNDTTPLSLAAFVGSRKCLETLLIAGADVSIVIKERATPLVRASVGGNVNIAKRFLKADCLINKSTRRFENALKCHLKHCRPVKRDLANDLFQDLLGLKRMRVELKDIYREAIRKHLLKLDPHQHLFGRVPRLELPVSVIQFLLYGESIEEKESGLPSGIVRGYLVVLGL